MTNEKINILKDVYSLISELWCSPQDINAEEISNEAKKIIHELKNMQDISFREDLRGAADLLSRFLNENQISEDEYIDLFELEPKCSLYLGSHSFDEPKTCAGAGVSDRNKYMIDLQGVYKHFKRAIIGNELPDYLPMMIDFLSLTAESRNDSVREKFIREFIVPFLPPLRKRLEELKTPYLHLVDVLEKIINYECKIDSVLETESVS